MERKEEKYYHNIDEISLKDIVLKIKEYIRYFWIKKLYFIFPFILFVGYFVYKAKTTPAMYIAETKFFLEGGNSSVGGLGGLLGQIGMGGKKTNPYQIIEVAESKLQMSDVLFEKVSKDSVYLANKILEIYDLPSKWVEESPEYLDFIFKHDSIKIFTELEYKVLLRVIRRVIDNSNNNALLRTDIEDGKGYYYIMAQTLNHDLTFQLSQISYAKLRIYFEEKTREKLRITRDLLKVKSDSIKYLLNSKISQLADFRDRNRSIVNNIGQVKEVVLASEIKGLNSAYMEVLKSFEMADYKYLDQQNNFMLIDKPMPPLALIMPNWKMEAIKGGILSLILTFGILFILKIYRDIMDS